MDGGRDGRADNRSCRLTGAATFTGVGIYALRQAQLQGTFQRVRPKGGSIVGGQVTAVIGIGELSHLFSFCSSLYGLRADGSLHITRIREAGYVGFGGMESRLGYNQDIEGRGRGLGWNRRKMLTGCK